MDLNIDEELESLQSLATSELRERYAEVWNEEPRSRNRPYLIRRIIWRMQANAEGDLSERARRRAEELADDAEIRVTPPRKNGPRKKLNGNGKVRDARLPPANELLTRDYKGVRVEVLVLDDGFQFEGETYRSLSAIANRITGTHTNGFRFFGLGGES